MSCCGKLGAAHADYFEPAFLWQNLIHEANYVQQVENSEVFLIFKEGVNNIVRHAHCTRVETALTIQGNRLRLRIRDDGRGFDQHRQSEGTGLDSMRGRAENIGGVLEIESAPGSGTTLELELPLNQYRWWHRWRDD